MNYGIPADRIVAYTYEADYHCSEDAMGRFGTDENHPWVPEDATDSEGNPVHPVFTIDMDVETVTSCSDCQAVICLCCGEKSTERPIGAPCGNCATAWRIEE